MFNMSDAGQLVDRRRLTRPQFSSTKTIGSVLTFYGFSVDATLIETVHT